MSADHSNALGLYLRDRRARLDPAKFGLSTLRRRTPGLRREEVAERARVSTNWYTWLEQGHGGAPSTETLDRIAVALALLPAEREHLFLLAQQRPPSAEYNPTPGVNTQLRTILDSLLTSPAYVKTLAWDVLAWNPAAEAVLTGFAQPMDGRRNIMRTLFCDPRARSDLADWEEQARFAVAAFRSDVARAPTSEVIEPLIAELLTSGTDFARLWHEQDVRSYGVGTKRLKHAAAGLLTLDHSAFWADGRADLSLIIYTPATLADQKAIENVVGEYRAIGPENTENGRQEDSR